MKRDSKLYEMRIFWLTIDKLIKVLVDVLNTYGGFGDHSTWKLLTEAYGVTWKPTEPNVSITLLRFIYMKSWQYMQELIISRIDVKIIEVSPIYTSEMAEEQNLCPECVEYGRLWWVCQEIGYDSTNQRCIFHDVKIDCMG